eukprot:TRINITY_DN2532_c0_g1_i1.p1 TRINITY_DN2532_c0_g1~~TRINITY_DN2532_c0_g1_i1.p1  ORF type:complete len:408 (-),score=56.25 TRINITY_DN2532_c0_g1_i1:68-1291(-)
MGCDSSQSVTPSNAKLEEEQNVVLYVTLASASLSLFGASFMLVSFLLYSRGRLLSQMIACLALGDFGWALAVMGQTISLIMAQSKGENPLMEPLGPSTPASSDDGSLPETFLSWQCGFRFIIYFFGTSTYIWTTCIAHYVLRTVSSGGNDEEAAGPGDADRLLKYCYHAIGWGLPLGITFLLAPSFDPTSPYCSGPEFYLIILYSLVILDFTINFVIFVVVLTAHRSQFGTSGLWMYYRSDGKLVIPIPLRLGMYLLVFFCCWGFDVITFAMLYNGCDIFTLNVLAFAVANMQGIFDCIVYGLISTPLRRNYTWTSGIVTFLLGPLLVVPAMFLRMVKSPSGGRHRSSSRSQTSSNSSRDRGPYPSSSASSLGYSYSDRSTTSVSSRDSLADSGNKKTAYASWIAIN